MGMEKRHAEYVEYYRARLAGCEGNPLYPHTAAAERALFEAISTAASLEEFRQREAAGQLSLRCAIARVRDTEAAEARFYQELEEVVRAQPCLEILRRLDESPPQTVEDLNSLVTSVHDRWNARITADETLRDELWDDWKILEDIECDERAVVPPRWHEERRRAVARELEKGAAHYREHTLPETRKFVPDYAPDYEALWELRHRRRFPLGNDIVGEKIAAHRRYRGIA
jgi:hypothetical protein